MLVLKLYNDKEFLFNIIRIKATNSFFFFLIHFLLAPAVTVTSSADFCWYVILMKSKCVSTI